MPAKLQRIKTDDVRPNSMPLSQKVETCKKLISQYGMLAPPVVGDFGDGTKTLLYGDCELKAMIEMKTDYAESMVVSLKDKAEGDKLALMLMEMRYSPDAVSQGNLINSLIDSGLCTQTEIAALLSRSVSWVNKRLSLATRLLPEVRDMVSSRVLSPQSAQEIARMPQKVQQGFSSKVVSAKIPKSAVEKLVAEYSKADCPDDLKMLIVDDPARAVGLIPEKPAIHKELAVSVPNEVKRSDIPLEYGLGSAITSCSASMTALVAMIFKENSAALYKHNKALKQLCVDIDATLKIISKTFAEQVFPKEIPHD